MKYLPLQDLAKQHKTYKDYEKLFIMGEDDAFIDVNTAEEEGYPIADIFYMEDEHCTIWNLGFFTTEDNVRDMTTYELFMYELSESWEAVNLHHWNQKYSDYIQLGEEYYSRALEAEIKLKDAQEFYDEKEASLKKKYNIEEEEFE